jgi:spore maturation protein CgeB
MAAKGIETACYEVWPDVVILTSGFFVTPETIAVLRRRPHHVVLWCTESPYEDSRQLNFAPYVDTIIFNDPTNIEQFRQVNPRTFYLPHSFDPDIHHPGPSDQRNDFAWVGTGFPSRMDFFEQVEWKDLRVVLGGMWRGLDPDSPLRRYLISDDLEACCDNTTAADLYRGCTVSANLYRKESTDVDHSDGWAMGPREVELAATGTFFLREPRGEGDELLHMLPTFTEPGEFTELLHHYVAHPANAQELAGRARTAVAAGRSRRRPPDYSSSSIRAPYPVAWRAEPQETAWPASTAGTVACTQPSLRRYGRADRIPQRLVDRFLDRQRRCDGDGRHEQDLRRWPPRFDG